MHHHESYPVCRGCGIIASSHQPSCPRCPTATGEAAAPEAQKDNFSTWYEQFQDQDEHGNVLVHLDSKPLRIRITDGPMAAR